MHLHHHRFHIPITTQRYMKSNKKNTFSHLSFIAGLGLVENSSVVLVASMLISPLMVRNKNRENEFYNLLIIRILTKAVHIFQIRAFYIKTRTFLIQLPADFQDLYKPIKAPDGFADCDFGYVYTNVSCFNTLAYEWV